MSSKCEYSFVGVGDFWIRNRSTPEDHFVQLGNINEAVFAAEEEKLELRDYTSPGGGSCDTLARISGVTLALTISNLKPSTLAIGLRGAVTVQAAGAQTDELHTAYIGSDGEGLLQFDYLPDPAVPPVVTGASATPTFVEGTDYIFSRTGIIFLAGGSITDGLPLEVDYTALGTQIIEGLVSTGDEYEIVLDGVNESKSAAPVAAEFYRVKFSPLSELPFISADDYASIQLTGDVLSDDTKVGAGISKFMRVRLKTA